MSVAFGRTSSSVKSIMIVGETSCCLAKSGGGSRGAGFLSFVGSSAAGGEGSSAAGGEGFLGFLSFLGSFAAGGEGSLGTSEGSVVVCFGFFDERVFGERVVEVSTTVCFPLACVVIFLSFTIFIFFMSSRNFFGR